MGIHFVPINTTLDYQNEIKLFDFSLANYRWQFLEKANAYFDQNLPIIVSILKVYFFAILFSLYCKIILLY